MQLPLNIVNHVIILIMKILSLVALQDAQWSGWKSFLSRIHTARAHHLATITLDPKSPNEELQGPVFL